MKNTKKILHIITSLDAGGAERALHQLLKSGLGERFENQVISLRDSGVYGPEIEKLGVIVHSLSMHEGVGLFEAIKRVRSIIKSFQPDIIQGWMYHANLIASLSVLLATNSPKVFWNIRQTLYDIKKERLNTRIVIALSRLLGFFVDKIIYNSHKSKEQHESLPYLGYPKSKGIVIPNGFDLNLWKPNQEARNKIRQELGLDEDQILLGNVARYHPMKDHETFIKVSHKLALKYENLHICFCGKDVDLKNESIRQLLNTLPKERTHYLGLRKDMENVFPAFDLLCSSSAWGEGFPNVLGEAMACGVICAATDTGDSKVVIGDQEKISPARDIHRLVLILDNIISNLQINAKKENPRQRIIDHFSIELNLESYTSEYNS